MVACKPGTPEQYIQPDEMEDLLVDYYAMRGLAQEESSADSRDYKKALYTEMVFRKHGITKEQFDSSMVYYYSRSERFATIYKHVVERLDRQAVALGASEGEIGKYLSADASGDTANIWVDRTTMALMPLPPRNRYEFDIAIDSTFRKGDKFMLQFMSDYYYQSGSKNGIVVLTASFEGDTTVTRSTYFSSTGLNQLRLEGVRDRQMKRLRGFFYLGASGEPTTTMRLLFLSNIQLIRFHLPDESSNTPKDSIQTDSLERTVDRTPAVIEVTSSRDTVRHSNPTLSIRKGTVKNRVDAGTGESRP